MKCNLQNQITRGKTFDFPQAYRFTVIFVKENIVYGVLIEPLTLNRRLVQYPWNLFEQLIGKVLIPNK